MKKNLAFFPLMISAFICIQAQTPIEASPAFEVLAEFDKVRDFTTGSSEAEAYVTIQSTTEEVSVISKLSKQNGEWNIKVVSFSGKYKDLEPFLSSNGLRLYFVSNRPIQDTVQTPKDYDIWYVERTSKEKPWGKPVNLGHPINSKGNEFYPSLSKNGNLYFTSDREGSLGKDDIFFSQWTQDGYTPPIGLDENINSSGFEYNTYISKDESYLLFGGYQREDGLGSGDIYISYRNEAGNWSKAKPLPASINSKYMDYCPFVDEENKQLYFTSRRDMLPTSSIESMKELKGYLNSYQNGNSRIYKAPFTSSEF
ncbi:MAG: hypothetical protein AAFY00_00415 [Bacteroidota bacterium]